MYLSKKQIEEIARQIASISKKDSDFNETFELNGEDYVAIVQDGENRLISGNTFRNELQNGPRGESAYEVAKRVSGMGDNFPSESNWPNDPINGIKGVGIKSITETASQESSGTNVWRVSLTDGTRSNFNVKNGKGVTSILKTSGGVGSNAENIITVTYSEGPSSQFIIRNGEQGNSGYSGAAGELEVVNNLTDGGATAALSAEQGKKLGIEVNSLLSTKSNYLESGFNKKIEVPSLDALALEQFNLGSDGNYGTGNTYKHLRLDVSPGDLLYVKTASNVGTRLVFMTNANCPSGGEAIPAVTDGIIALAADKEYLLEVPEGTVIAGINDGQDGNQRPESIIVYEKKHEALTWRQIKSIGCGYYYGIPAEGGSGTLSRAPGTFGLNICFRVRAGKKYVATTASFPASTECRRALLPSLPYVGCPLTDGVTQGQAEGGFYNGERASFFYNAPSDGYYMITAFNQSVTVYELDDALDGESAFIKKELESIRANDGFDEVILDELPARSYTISEFGCWRYSASRHKLVPVEYGQQVRIVPNGSNSAFVAFLKSNSVVNEDSADSSDLVPYVRYRVMYNQSEQILTVPKDARYLYVAISTPAYNYKPSYVGISAASSGSVDAGAAAEEFSIRRLHEGDARSAMIPLTKKAIISDGNGWEIADTVQQEIFVKKIKQLSNIKWTPKKDVPGNHFTKLAGVEYTGIPYSSNRQLYKLVGISVSLETFMTAVNNPYSLLYTEKANKLSSRSDWGIVYHDSNAYSYFGLVCNSFAAAVYGINGSYDNGQIRNMNYRSETFIPVCAPMTVDLNLLKIGDLANNGMHCFVIMGIKRDSSGNITRVKTAEEFPYESYDCPRIYDRTVESFVHLITQSDESDPGVPAELGQYPYIISRYNGMYANTKYTPSPFVKVDDESEPAYVYNNDICTFAGDKASFGDGELVVINYNLTDAPSHQWTAIEVYKDDEILQTYTLASIVQTDLPEDQRGHALNLGRGLSAGKYKARLTDGTNYSDYTYWEVLKANVTVTPRSGGRFDIESSAPFSMLQIGYMNTENDDTYFHIQRLYHMSYEELAKWKFTIYPQHFLEKDGYTMFDSESFRLVLIGEYGKALSSVVPFFQ